MLCPDINALDLKRKTRAFPSLGQGDYMKRVPKTGSSPRHWSHRWCCLTALLSCGGLWAQADLNPSPAALNLQNQARQWFSQQKSYPLDHIQMSAMDGKLVVGPCMGSLRFDQPFQNQNVIRARCSEPNSQYFMTAQVSPMVLNTAQAPSIPLVTPNSPPSKATDLKPVASSKSEPQATLSTVFLPATYKPSLNPNEVIKTVLVVNQPLRRGTMLQASLFRRVEAPIANTDGQVLTQFKEIENSELLHDMGSDQVLHNFDIKPALMVKKGQQVTVMVGEGRGFLITVKAEAQQDGALGDQIRLKNIDSGRSISGVITGVNEVKVL